MLGASDLLGVLAPQALVEAGDNLRRWVAARWPTAVWHREIPITAAIASPDGPRRIAGIIDLLLEVPDGVILIDHKSYPGSRESWRAKAAEFAPQFAAYGEALKHAGKVILEQWVHFTIAGGAVRLSTPELSEKELPSA